MGAKEKAISELDSRLFVIPENWHRKRIMKCYIKSETVCHPEEFLWLIFSIAALCMTLRCI